MQDENKPEDLAPQAPKPDVVPPDPTLPESQAPTSPTPSAKTADPIAVPATTAPAAPQGNTSGQGSSAVVPEEVKGWSWGAFFLTWIWGIGNSVWLALLVFVPFVNWVMPFVLGVKGREWAWQAKHWDSVEQFNKTQKTWGIVGLITAIIGIVIMILWFMIVGVAIFSAFNNGATSSTTKTY